MTADRTTFDLNGEQIAGDLLWEADFSNPDSFRAELQGGTVDYHEDSLEVDSTPERSGATVWYEHEFPEDVLVEYTATCHEEDDDEVGGRNFNCFFAATGEDGSAASLDEAELSGAYGEYHELPNYIFTLTYRHSRMRRDPGFDRRSEFIVGAQPNHSYDVQILKRGDTVAATLDGRLIHHWTDPEPLSSGWVGLRTWNTHVTYDRWAVYEPGSD